MKLQPAVKQETTRIALGVIILTALMVSVFLLIGQFDSTVFLGALLGAAAAILNFFLMALSVQKAAEQMNGVTLPPAEEKPDGEEAGEEKEQPLSPQALRAKRNMQLSYTGRMALLACFAIAAVSIPVFHPVAALAPLLFPRIVIFINGLVLQKKGASGHE